MVEQLAAFQAVSGKIVDDQFRYLLLADEKSTITTWEISHQVPTVKPTGGGCG